MFIRCKQRRFQFTFDAAFSLSHNCRPVHVQLLRRAGFAALLLIILATFVMNQHHEQFAEQGISIASHTHGQDGMDDTMCLHHDGKLLATGSNGTTMAATSDEGVLEGVADGDIGDEGTRADRGGDGDSATQRTSRSSSCTAGTCTRHTPEEELGTLTTRSTSSARMRCACMRRRRS